MKNKPKNPHAVALGRKGGSKATEAQKKAARTNGKKGGRPKAAKLYPSVYEPPTMEEMGAILQDHLGSTTNIVTGFDKKSKKWVDLMQPNTSPRRHTRTEVPIGKGVAKARKDGAA